MGRRVLGLGFLFIAAVVVAWVVRPAPGLAIAMCSPVTIDDLIARSQPATSSPTPSTDGNVATTAAPAPACDKPFVYPLVFPIVGGGGIGSPFGAPRDGGSRLHEGNDVFAPRMQPVVAAAAGTVIKVSADTGISGYRVIIGHDDGWLTYYIHLNNDTLGTDDGSGIGIWPDLALGDRVEPGQVIGWVGDSGNAEGTEAHLHFELHEPAGAAVDPGPSLKAAARVSLPGEGVIEFAGPFADASDGDQPDSLAVLLSRGAPVRCDESGVMSCPDDPVTRAAASAWLTALVGPIELVPDPYSEPPRDRPVGDCSPTLACLSDGSVDHTLLCSTTDCTPTGVTRDDLVRAVAWDRLRDAYELAHVDPAPSLRGGPGAPRVSPPPTHAYDLALARANRIIGPTACRAPDSGEGELTRRQAAAALIDLLGLGDPQCVSENAAISASSR